MARVQKIDNSILKTFLRKEKKRAEGIKIKRVYFLIVCEGEQTEPNYFEAFSKELNTQSIYVADMQVEGVARNTISLIDYTLKLKDRQLQRFDRVWAVFDKDSFRDEDFNNAIEKAQNQGISPAWSNEAFELWFLLHFNYVSTSMPREDYKKQLEKAIRSSSGNNSYTYKKNDQSTFFTLNKYGDQAKAIKWSKKLIKEHSGEKYAKHNPCTKVHELIEELLNPELGLKKNKKNTL